MKTLLFILVSFLTITTILAALMMMSVPDGSLLSLSTDILKKSVFKDFVLPGLLLLMFVGIINLFALVYNLTDHRQKYNFSIAGASMMILWILIQYMIIKQTLVFDVVYLILGLSVILISLQLKGKSLI